MTEVDKVHECTETICYTPAPKMVLHYVTSDYNVTIMLELRDKARKHFGWFLTFGWFCIDFGWISPPSYRLL